MESILQIPTNITSLSSEPADFIETHNIISDFLTTHDDSLPTINLSNCDDIDNLHLIDTPVVEEHISTQLGSIRETLDIDCKKTNHICSIFPLIDDCHMIEQSERTSIGRQIKNEDQESHYSELWNKHYQELVDFFNDNGHSDVPRNYLQNKPLEKWVYTQRMQYNKKIPSRLTPTRIKSLEKVNFQWSQDQSKGQSTFFPADIMNETQAKASRDIHELAILSVKVVKTEMGEDDSIHTPNKNSIPPLEKPRAFSDEKWKVRFKELIEFRRKHGHCAVPRKYAPNKKLGIWVNQQRIDEKKLKSSPLLKHRYKSLQQLGFEWSKPLQKTRDQIWLKRYKELEDFFKEFGHSSVPYNYKSKELSSWVNTQRHTRASLIKTPRYEMLNKLNFQWGFKKKKRIKLKNEI